MSLQFVFGNSGSGKSDYLYQSILEEAEREPEKNFLLLVPEQFTMQTQRELVWRQPNHAIMNVDVLSFVRLAYRVFDDLGMQDLVILEEEINRYSDEVIVMTDDGSYGRRGLVTEGMEEVIKREKIDMAVTIGPAIMMKFCSKLTEKYAIPTIASLNAIMVDGTGMCGACRVTVGGKTRFTCIDGPEFDAHQIDFDEMMSRLGGYKNIETEKMGHL